ncbi:DUF6148 family protein [Ruminiclostridium josui]|uniref:DUF6148 family protein n=1 Tax=Ruminiclostridium josui TaxID=1499 RepID=UPI00046320B2|nr:DUF6148 family protein [Ruminiclostridium josui]
MPAWTLEEARARLKMWLDAEAAVATGQSYQINGRRLDRANLYQIREEIQMWKREVEELEALRKIRGRRKAFRITLRDL